MKHSAVAVRFAAGERPEESMAAQKVEVLECQRRSARPSAASLVASSVVSLMSEGVVLVYIAP